MNKLLLTVTLSILVFKTCRPIVQDKVCLPDWTPRPGQQAAFGINIETIVTLKDCLGYCEFEEANCTAVEYESGSDKPCWIHLLGHSNINDLYPNSNITQYILHRNCTVFDSGSPDDGWERLGNTHSIHGVQANYWTEIDCFYLCQYTSKCIAIDFDMSTSPPCWIHWDPNDLSEQNTYPETGVVQYRLKITSTQNNAVKSVSRCSGQQFPTDSLCDEDTEVMHIIKSNFKANPFCCNPIGAETIPPDSNTLSDYLVAYFDNAYDAEIRQKCNSSGCSELVSKSFPNSTSVDGIKNNFCNSAETFDKTNLVVIFYKCLPFGVTEAESNASTTPYIPPTIPPSTVNDPSKKKTTPNSIEVNDPSKKKTVPTATLR